MKRTHYRPIVGPIADQDFLLDEPDEFSWRAVEGRSVLRPTPSTGTAHEMLAAESCVRRYLPDLARAFDECVAENSDERASPKQDHRSRTWRAELREARHLRCDGEPAGSQHSRDRST